jgi:rod shape-determining protein MreC
MRNLIRFLSRFSFFFLFLLFELVCFYLLFQNNHFQQAAYLHSANSFTAGVYKRYSNFTDYLDLKEVNRELAAENQRLRERQLLSYQKVFGPNFLIRDTLYQKKYLYTKGKVVNNSINKQNNFLTLNIGERNGIERGMGVLGPQGVVGIVTQSSEHYSTVLSLLHRRSRVGSKLKDSEYFGSLQWDGIDYRQGVLKDIPNHVVIGIGDTIVTSGYSSIFPAEIPVATIAEFEEVPGENFYDIKVDFTTNFKNLSYVYVVKNLHRAEFEALEEAKEGLNNDQ